MPQPRDIVAYIVLSAKYEFTLIFPDYAMVYSDSSSCGFISNDKMHKIEETYLVKPPLFCSVLDIQANW